MDKKQLKELRRPYVRQFFKKNRLNLALTVFSAVLAGAANLGISWSLQKVFDVIDGNTSLGLGTVVLISVGFLGLLLLSGTIDYFFLSKFRAKAVKQYRDHVFEELTKKGIQAFASENTATYISALSNDIAAIETNALNVIQGAVQLGLSFVGALVLMLYNSPLLTVIAIAFSLLPIVVSVIFGNKLAVYEKTLSDKKESYLAAVKDALTGFAVIKSFKAERAIAKLHREKNEEVENAQIKRGKVNVIITYISSLANAVTQFGVFFVAAWFALGGLGVTTGMVVLFIQLMNFLIMPISDFPKYYAGWKSSEALIDKLALAVNGNTPSEGEPMEPVIRDGIRMDKVSFSYEEGKPVLKNVDIELKAGTVTALVGGSGSGKSTVLNLLMSAYSGYEGSITYDGREIRGISTESLYEAVSMIQQSVFVFNSTIRDNITMFSDFPEDEIERAVNMSGLKKLIEEKGADYLCGENGSGLSGGERQRISIARALLRKTPVLFVDEATAALDAETSFAVLNSIISLEGYTRLIVTHDLDEAILKKCDQVIALRNGRVAENGTFDELMNKKGYFYSLYTVSQN